MNFLGATQLLEKLTARGVDVSDLDVNDPKVLLRALMDDITGANKVWPRVHVTFKSDSCHILRAYIFLRAFYCSIMLV